MKNDFGQFSEGLVELAHEMWEFRTCQRSDGSYYGTGGQCRKGTETDKPDEKPRGKKPVDSGSMGKMSDSQLKQLAGRKELDTAQKAAISKELQDRKNASLNAGNMPGQDKRTQDAEAATVKDKEANADIKTLRPIRNELLKNNATLIEREVGDGPYDSTGPKELTSKQAKAMENQGGRWGENDPMRDVVKANEQAIINAAKTYKGGKEGLARDAHIANNWDPKKQDGVDNEKVRQAAQDRVEKATQTAYQKYVQKEYGIKLPADVRSPWDIVSQGNNNGIGYNDKYTGGEVFDIILGI